MFEVNQAQPIRTRAALFKRSVYLPPTQSPHSTAQARRSSLVDMCAARTHHATATPRHTDPTTRRGSQSRSRSRSRAWDGAVVVARARSNTMRSSRVVSSCCVHGETREDEKREDDVAAEGASAGRSGPDNCSPYSRTMRRPSPGRDAAAGGGDAAGATAAGASTGDAQRGSASAAASRRAPPGISTVPWRRKTRYGRRATRDWRYWSGASGVGHRRVERPRALFCQKVTLITPA